MSVSWIGQAFVFSFKEVSSGTYTSIDHAFVLDGEKLTVTFADDRKLVAFCVIAPDDPLAW